MFKWKSFSMISLSVLLIAMLAACGGSKNEKSDAKNGIVTLDFWIFGSTNYKELAEEYEKQNPNVKIKIKTSETDSHHDALFTTLSAGNGAPDITMLEIDQLDRFKEAGDRFENLYDLGANDVKDKYLDWKWESGESVDGDVLFGLPTDIGPKALYYTPDIFEEAGLPTDPDEVAQLINSPEAFEKAGIQIKEKTGKLFIDSIEMAFRAYLDAAETAYFTSDNELNLGDDSEVKKAYDYAVHLNDLGLVGNLEMWSPEWTNAVNKGEFAVELGAGWLKGWMEGNAPDASGKWRVATLPTEFAANWGGSYIAIPSETKHAQEAYDFIEWLVSPENQLESFKSHGLFPSAQSVYDMSEFTENKDEFFGEQATAVVFAEAAQDISGIGYKGTKYQAIHSEILNGLKNVQNKKADPDKEWEAAVKRAQDLLKR